ncbi:hypothetical protein NicSoilB4_10380 [Arthrobacter sp. NicSoilB4]|uniref:hypothetical protein n=1 Tax=Arthrobacter sp. NicSoilB4 TaxID=2830997 RepID=UPI001CC40259|nr:hypothetical protein [Arthrobacter sp. NicSoilB4]BCW66275.1 hypothetical protein NicSoilB4_10380 [Arthrobacter sp. NicSoilB4]
MHFSDHRAAGAVPPAGTTAATKLPVPVSRLRWALVRRLFFAIPLGLLFGVMLFNGFTVDGSEPATTAAFAGGMGLSFSLFLGTIWIVGHRRRALFAASGGDPEAAGVLLFGAMAPRIGRLGPYSESGFHRWAAGFGAGGDGGRGDWG